jgi:molybdenum cofactor cytidylyltransferase
MSIPVGKAMKSDFTLVILAGGYSTRMQQFKPLLPLNGATVIGTIIKTFRDAGIEEIVVVAGHNADRLSHGVADLGVRVVFNAKYAEGMYSSVFAGVSALPSGVAASLIMPADMPLVRSRTVTALCNAFSRTGASVVYPVFEGRRGHPTLISSRWFSAILSGDGAGGLRALLAEQGKDAHEEKVPDEGILLGLDTPADYARACELFRQRDIPTPAECRAILEQMKVTDDVVRHSKRVAEAAGRLAVRLNDNGLCLNVVLVRAAAILHDLAKGQPDHAKSGARMLADLGFSAVAQIVALHMDCDFKEGTPLDEAAIVYLADKLVQGDRVVSISERFKRSFEKTGAGPSMLFVKQRWETTQSIIRAVQQVLGADLQGLISTEN